MQPVLFDIVDVARDDVEVEETDKGKVFTYGFCIKLRYMRPLSFEEVMTGGAESSEP